MGPLRLYDLFVTWVLVPLVVFALIVGLTVLVTRKWEYRAVYHMDCASYATES